MVPFLLFMPVLVAHARGCSHSGQSRRQNTDDYLNNRFPRLLLHLFNV